MDLEDELRCVQGDRSIRAGVMSANEKPVDDMAGIAAFGSTVSSVSSAVAKGPATTTTSASRKHIKDVESAHRLFRG